MMRANQYETSEIHLKVNLEIRAMHAKIDE